MKLITYKICMTKLGNPSAEDGDESRVAVA
jgi:hypothetical protein